MTRSAKAANRTLLVLLITASLNLIGPTRQLEANTTSPEPVVNTSATETEAITSQRMGDTCVFNVNAGDVLWSQATPLIVHILLQRDILERSCFKIDNIAGAQTTWEFKDGTKAFDGQPQIDLYANEVSIISRGRTHASPLVRLTVQVLANTTATMHGHAFFQKVL